MQIYRWKLLVNLHFVQRIVQAGCLLKRTIRRRLWRIPVLAWRFPNPRSAPEGMPKPAGARIRRKMAYIPIDSKPAVIKNTSGITPKERIFPYSQQTSDGNARIGRRFVCQYIHGNKIRQKPSPFLSPDDARGDTPHALSSRQPALLLSNGNLNRFAWQLNSRQGRTIAAAAGTKLSRNTGGITPVKPTFRPPDLPGSVRAFAGSVRAPELYYRNIGQSVTNGAENQENQTPAPAETERSATLFSTAVRSGSRNVPSGAMGKQIGFMEPEDMQLPQNGQFNRWLDELSRALEKKWRMERERRGL